MRKYQDTKYNNIQSKFVFHFEMRLTFARFLARTPSLTFLDANFTSGMSRANYDL